MPLKKMMREEKKAVMAMDPGAMNRVAEISSHFADAFYSVILDGVADGVVVCKAPPCPLTGGSRRGDVD